MQIREKPFQMVSSHPLAAFTVAEFKLALSAA